MRPRLPADALRESRSEEKNVAQHCNVRLASNHAEWNALFSRVEEPHMVQSWAYGEAKQAAVHWRNRRVAVDLGGWRARRLVFERCGEPVAICQLLDKSVAGIRCASRVNRGPLFLGPDPGDAAVRDVYRALRNRWRHLRGVLVLAPALTADPRHFQLLSGLGFRDRHLPGWRSARVDLRLDEEQLRKNLTTKWRNRLKSAERAGLTLREGHAPEDVEWIIDRHVENMKEKDFVGPQPIFLRALYQAAPDNLLVFQARLGDEAVGGMMVYRFGHGAEYYIGWTGAEGRGVNAGNFLYWRIALDLKRRGRQWVDLGGTRLATLGQMKRGMRGAEYELLNEWLAF